MTLSMQAKIKLDRKLSLSVKVKSLMIETKHKY